MRGAITIGYNCRHHLEHNGWAEFMAENFDRWVFIEGLAGNGGSTGWCNNLELPARSDDGTHEFMEALADRHSHITYHSPGEKWSSKDKMARTATFLLDMPAGFLWQVDADEQWTAQKLKDVENRMSESRHRVAACQFRHHVKQYIAKGKWGSGWVKRVWKYTPGQLFTSHEPPKLTNEGGEILFVPEKFEHYSYTFEQDIKFKTKYYQGYERLEEKWNALPDKPVLTINHLFERSNPIGRSATKLIRK